MITSYLFMYLPIVVNERAGGYYLALGMSVAYALSMVLSPIGGVLADNVGRKPLAILSPLLLLPSLLLILFNDPLSAITISSAFSLAERTDGAWAHSSYS